MRLRRHDQALAGHETWRMLGGPLHPERAQARLRRAPASNRGGKGKRGQASAKRRGGTTKRPRHGQERTLSWQRCEGVEGASRRPAARRMRPDMAVGDLPAVEPRIRSLPPPGRRGAVEPPRSASRNGRHPAAASMDGGRGSLTVTTLSVYRQVVIGDPASPATWIPRRRVRDPSSLILPTSCAVAGHRRVPMFRLGGGHSDQGERGRPAAPGAAKRGLRRRRYRWWLCAIGCPALPG